MTIEEKKTLRKSDKVFSRGLGNGVVTSIRKDMVYAQYPKEKNLFLSIIAF